MVSHIEEKEDGKKGLRGFKKKRNKSINKLMIKQVSHCVEKRN